MTMRNNTKPQNYQAVRMELNIETMKGWASGGYVDTPFDTADEMCEAGMVAADLLVMGSDALVKSNAVQTVILTITRIAVEEANFGEAEEAA